MANTASLLHDRSADIPEGLYLDLMNNLKIDFDTKEETVKTSTMVFVINKTLPKSIPIRKQDMIKCIIKESINWPDREKILLKITGKVCVRCIKDICIMHGLPIMHENPRWAREQDQRSQNPRFAEAYTYMRIPGNGVFTIPH